MSTEFTRRAFVGAAAAMAGGMTLGTGSAFARPAVPALVKPDRKRAIRLAHLTDFHIQPELSGDQGVVACFKHLQNQADKADLVLTGGDTVFDVFEHDFDRATMLWQLWNKVRQDHCGIPIEAAIGNHDIWGWNKKKSKTTGQERGWGKAWAMEMLGLAKPYRSFDKAGWHFVVLDTVHPDGEGYVGKLDEEQHAWLAADLEKTDPRTPVLVLSHIPIFCAATVLESSKTDETTKRVSVSGSEMLTDVRRIVELFKKHPNVKVCLSGHIHLVDRVDYNGVTYLCNGAVSGAWWKGRHVTCDEGYALVDLYDDGSFENRYVTYGWQAKK